MGVLIDSINTILTYDFLLYYQCKVSRVESTKVLYYLTKVWTLPQTITVPNAHLMMDRAPMMNLDQVTTLLTTVLMEMMAIVEVVAVKNRVLALILA